MSLNKVFKSTAAAQHLVLTCALLISATAVAQVNQPRATPTPSNPPPAPPILLEVKPVESNGLFIVPGSGSPFSPAGIRALDPATMVGQFEEQRQKLRAQLADPEARREIVAVRLQAQRELNPDLARVLRIDAETEARLLMLLVDQQLADEVNSNPFDPASRLRPGDEFQVQQAQEYDAKLQDVAKLIGPARMESYAEYAHTRSARMVVERFNVSLPRELALSTQQKDALVTVIAADRSQRASRVAFFKPFGAPLGAGPMSLSPQELNRRNNLTSLGHTEQMLRSAEAANSAVLEQLPRFLGAEQVQAYARTLTQQLEGLRLRSRQLRAELGLSEDAPLDLDASAPPPAVPANLQLNVNVRVNGTEFARTATSKAGGVVKFAGPGGLRMEVQPTLLSAEQLMIELKVYEVLRGTQYLLGEGSLLTLLNQASQSSPGVTLGSAGGSQLFRGRKAYVISWNATPTSL